MLDVPRIFLWKNRFSFNNPPPPVCPKEYLKSLGNSECSPQTFLENSSSLDKLLIIIQNEDIAAHVHKVPERPASSMRSNCWILWMD